MEELQEKEAEEEEELKTKTISEWWKDGEVNKTIEKEFACCAEKRNC